MSFRWQARESASYRRENIPTSQDETLRKAQGRLWRTRIFSGSNKVSSTQIIEAPNLHGQIVNTRASNASRKASAMRRNGCVVCYPAGVVIFFPFRRYFLRIRMDSVPALRIERIKVEL